jgi:hypothetical protein
MGDFSIANCSNDQRVKEKNLSKNVRRVYKGEPRAAIM